MNVHHREKMIALHKWISDCTDKDAIMVLDDVVTTGSRLSTYQKRLRDIGYIGQIHYLVGVRRMPSIEDWEELRRTLKPNNCGPDHTTSYVEHVLLPNWNELSCPLCMENNLLDELIKDQSIALSPWALERANLLRNCRSKGLEDDVFFGARNLAPLRITNNSFFVKEGAPQSVVLCSVAAAMQELRTHESPLKRLEPRGFPVRTVCSVKDLDTFSDGILRAALLRCASPTEYQRISLESEKPLIEWSKGIFNGNDVDCRNTQPEVALAVGLRKLPIDVASADVKKQIIKQKFRDLIAIMEAGRS